MTAPSEINWVSQHRDSPKSPVLTRNFREKGRLSGGSDPAFWGRDSLLDIIPSAGRFRGGRKATRAPHGGGRQFRIFGAAETGRKREAEIQDLTTDPLRNSRRPERPGGESMTDGNRPVPGSVATSIAEGYRRAAREE